MTRGANMAITPVFLFSLPRSGSTFTQRALATHPSVATSSEPWLLLPYFYTLHAQGAYTEYGHYLMVSAVRDFCRELPGGEDAYRARLRDFVLGLYADAAGEATHFVDKTPRYHLIVDEVMQTFPDGKFIFLWRNPLAVIASIVETFGKGRWILYVLKVDLFDGARALVSACERYGNRALAVQYEHLVNEPEKEFRRVFAYLGLEFDHTALQRLDEMELKGRLGDRTGVARYREVSREPLEKWKRVLANPVRKAWCRRYLRWLGRERLALMGYDLDVLLADLNAIPNSTRHLFSDLVQIAFGFIYAWFEPGIMRDKFKRLPVFWRIHGHR